MNKIARSAGFVLASPADFCWKFLLIQHRYGEHWDFPKGTLEPGESDWQAALRELEEETGITDIEPIADFQHQIHYQFRRDQELIDKTVTYYLATTPHQTLSLSHEHIDGGWFDEDAARSRLSYDSSRELLDEAVKMLQNLS